MEIPPAWPGSSVCDATNERRRKLFRPDLARFPRQSGHLDSLEGRRLAKLCRRVLLRSALTLRKVTHTAGTSTETKSPALFLWRIEEKRP